MIVTDVETVTNNQLVIKWEITRDGITEMEHLWINLNDVKDPNPFVDNFIEKRLKNLKDLL